MRKRPRDVGRQEHDAAWHELEPGLVAERHHVPDRADDPELPVPPAAGVANVPRPACR